MTPTFWTWAMEHWFLSFIMAMVILKIVSRTLKTILAPLKRFVPQEPAAAEPEEEAEEEPEVPEPAESEREVQAVVVPIRRRRSRFDRI